MTQDRQSATHMLDRDRPHFAMTPEWLLFSPDVSPTAKTLYAILDRCGPEKFPGRDWLRERLGVSMPTLDKAMKELADLGVIRKEARYVDGRQTTNRYVLAEHPPEGWEGQESLPAGDQEPLTAGAKNLGVGGPRILGTEPEHSNERDLRPSGSGAARQGSPPVATDKAKISPDGKGKVKVKNELAAARGAAADRLTKEWWDGWAARGAKPMQPYVAVRGLVVKALTAGYSEAAVGAALRSLGTRTVATWNLQGALTGADRPAAFGHVSDGWDTTGEVRVLDVQRPRLLGGSA